MIRLSIFASSSKTPEISFATSTPSIPGEHESVVGESRQFFRHLSGKPTFHLGGSRSIARKRIGDLPSTESAHYHLTRRASLVLRYCKGTKAESSVIKADTELPIHGKRSPRIRSPSNAVLVSQSEPHVP